MWEKVGKRVLEEGRRRRRVELINGGGDALRYIIKLADSFANKSLTVTAHPQQFRTSPSFALVILSFLSFRGVRSTRRSTFPAASG